MGAHRTAARDPRRDRDRLLRGVRGGRLGVADARARRRSPRRSALVGVALALGRLRRALGRSASRSPPPGISHNPRGVSPRRTGCPAKLAGAPVQPGVSLLRVPVKRDPDKRRRGAGRRHKRPACSRRAGRAGRFAASRSRRRLAEAYGKWLNSLVEPAAITVRSEPVDLTERATAIEHAAPGLPHPALRRCAHTYAQFLAELRQRGRRTAPPSNPARAEHPQPRARDGQG